VRRAYCRTPYARERKTASALVLPASVPATLRIWPRNSSTKVKGVDGHPACRGTLFAFPFALWERRPTLSVWRRPTQPSRLTALMFVNGGVLERMAVTTRRAAHIMVDVLVLVYH